MTMTPTIEREQPLILLADDDKDIVALVAYRLEAAGYRVITANDGQQALDFALEHSPALAVLDVRMPKLSGIDVVRAIREQDSVQQMPVILLSASVQEQNVAKGFDAGADDYMKKPFSPQELLARIQTSLGRR